MSTNHHTPYQDSVTEYKASDMNAPLSELDTAITALSGEYVGGSYPYDIGLSYMGKPAVDAVLLRYPFPRVVQFDYDMGNSQGIAGVAATGETVFSIKKDGVEFATATFAAEEDTATFSGETVIFSPGEILTLVAPDPQDGTLENLGFSLTGVR